MFECAAQLAKFCRKSLRVFVTWRLILSTIFQTTRQAFWFHPALLSWITCEFEANLGLHSVLSSFSSNHSAGFLISSYPTGFVHMWVWNEHVLNRDFLYKGIVTWMVSTLLAETNPVLQIRDFEYSACQACLTFVSHFELFNTFQMFRPAAISLRLIL